MAATRRQATGNSATAVLSVNITLASAPVAGNLLVVTHYSISPGSTLSVSSPAGFNQRFVATTGTGAGGAIHWKIADGTEGTTVTIASTTSNFQAGGVFEWDGGAAFSATPTDASGQTTGTSATTVSVTATAANANATDLEMVGVGVSGTETFATAWTGGFTDEALVIGSRLTHASKQTAAVETATTSITWGAARIPRAMLGNFQLPAAAPPGVTVQASPPVNRARFRASFW